jgi:hypothetical protein
MEFAIKSRRRVTKIAEEGKIMLRDIKILRQVLVYFPFTISTGNCPEYLTKLIAEKIYFVKVSSVNE